MFAMASRTDHVCVQSGGCPDLPEPLAFTRKPRPRRPRRALPQLTRMTRAHDLVHRPRHVPAPTSVMRRRMRDECAELAQALHDDLAQVLSYALIQLDMVHASPPDASGFRDAALRHSRDLIKDALRTTRDVIGGLLDAAQPTAPTLDAQCLLLAGEISRLTRQPIDVDCAPVTCMPPPAIGKVLLRAVRELLANACKHAPGARVKLTLRQETLRSTEIVLTVSDDGPGFDPSRLDASPRGHFGLQCLPGMLDDAGADFTLHTRPGKGVHGQIRWPARPRGQ